MRAATGSLPSRDQIVRGSALLGYVTLVMGHFQIIIGSLF
jgi:hypothetical protein